MIGTRPMLGLVSGALEGVRVRKRGVHREKVRVRAMVRVRPGVGFRVRDWALHREDIFGVLSQTPCFYYIYHFLKTYLYTIVTNSWLGSMKIGIRVRAIG